MNVILLCFVLILALTFRNESTSPEVTRRLAPLLERNDVVIGTKYFTDDDVFRETNKKN